MPDNIDDIAAKHGFSAAAARALAEALRHGGGRMAQFNHPDLGGMGQWSAGGMIMIGDMFNNSLKARVAALCDDLAAAPGPVPAAAEQQPRQTAHWWPQGLGQPLRHRCSERHALCLLSGPTPPRGHAPRQGARLRYRGSPHQRFLPAAKHRPDPGVHQPERHRPAGPFEGGLNYLDPVGCAVTRQSHDGVDAMDASPVNQAENLLVHTNNLASAVDNT